MKREDAPPGRLYEKLEEEKGKRIQDQGLRGALGKTKTKAAVPGLSGAPVPE